MKNKVRVRVCRKRYSYKYMYTYINREKERLNEWMYPTEKESVLEKDINIYTKIYIYIKRECVYVNV